MIYSSFIPSVARQIFALVAIFALFLTSVPVVFASNTIFENSFEEANFLAGGWTSVDSNWKITSGSGHTGNKKAEISGQSGGTDILVKEVSTVGYTGLNLTYYIKTGQPIEADDHVFVEWFNGSSWVLLVDHNSIDNGSWTIHSFNLPAGADDLSTFAFRFRAVGLEPSTGGGDKDEFQLDSVKLVASGTIVRECPDGTTGTYPDCVPVEEPCAEGEVRNDAGDCVPELIEECPDGTTGTYPDCEKVEEPCADGETRNDAGDCVPVEVPCEVGEVRNDAGDCVPVEEPCAEGEVRNDAGDCVPVEVPCEEGEARDEEGNCVPIDPETPRAPVTVCKYDDLENPLSGWTMYGTNGELTVSDVTDEDGCVTLFVPLSTDTPVSIYEENRAGWTQDSAFASVGGTLTLVSEESSVFQCEFPVYAATEEDMQSNDRLLEGAVAAPTLLCNFFNKQDEEEGGGDSSSTSTGGGGGGYTPRDRDAEPTPEVAGDSTSATPEPTPAVLGDQVSAVPYGAPNTGAGGTAAVQFGVAMTLLAAPRRFLVK